LEMADKKIGFITSGVSYLYVKEAFPQASVLKLAMVHPLSEKMIRNFAAQVDELIVVEELDPFLENAVKAMGIACKGKELLPAVGEFNSALLKKTISGESGNVDFKALDLPMRPPNMCPGCPHRGLFYNLARLKVFVSGDIGCYTLGALPPLSAMDACVCMGASIGMAHGMAKALGDDGLGREVAVIGDSTFMHSGITGLINTVYNKSYATVIILDNRITAMTGHQPNPASGSTLAGDAANAINFVELCRAVGVKHIKVLDPHDIEASRKILEVEINRPEPSVIISQAPCVLIPSERKRPKTPLVSVKENCTGCKICLGLGCPAISWIPLDETEALAMGKKAGQKGYMQIDPVLCVGCGQCLPLCKFAAISKGVA
ncbi:MAG: indolepyruvate ferredoxin oxidoreductase subunit alpha, partial [Deltaproteobacteria bacterium]|nr:indolepyruvate ferredoxin oxidoreductase subunit alpha [Deltaproteobacteria bacterium]